MMCDILLLDQLKSQNEVVREKRPDFMYGYSRITMILQDGDQSEIGGYRSVYNP